MRYDPYLSLRASGPGDVVDEISRRIISDLELVEEIERRNLGGSGSFVVSLGHLGYNLLEGGEKIERFDADFDKTDLDVTGFLLRKTTSGKLDTVMHSTFLRGYLDLIDQLSEKILSKGPPPTSPAPFDVPEACVAWIVDTVECPVPLGPDRQVVVDDETAKEMFRRSLLVLTSRAASAWMRSDRSGGSRPTTTVSTGSARRPS